MKRRKLKLVSAPNSMEIDSVCKNKAFKQSVQKALLIALYQEGKLDFDTYQNCMRKLGMPVWEDSYDGNQC